MPSLFLNAAARPPTRMLRMRAHEAANMLELAPWHWPPTETEAALMQAKR